MICVLPLSPPMSQRLKDYDRSLRLDISNGLREVRPMAIRTLPANPQWRKTASYSTYSLKNSSHMNFTSLAMAALW